MNKARREDDGRLDEGDAASLVAGTHGDPFGVLGPHLSGRTWLTRAFIPGAEHVSVASLDGRQLGTLTRRHEAGVFEGPVQLKAREAIRYTASNAGGTWSLIDPYSFGPVLGPMDDYYASEGTHLRLFDKLGAHILVHEGVAGVHFAVWAPNAKRVSVVGDFNGWDGRRHSMRHRPSSGMWEIFLPELARRHRLQIRDTRRGREAAAAQGGSVRLRLGASPEDRVDGRRTAGFPLDRRRLH